MQILTFVSVYRFLLPSILEWFGGGFCFHLLKFQEIKLSLIFNIYSRSSFPLQMKKFLYLIIPIVFFACQPRSKEDSSLVTVSILPQKYIVEQIAGNLLQINVLVPPGSSPHNYEVLASQMKDLAKSKVWLQIGLLTFEDAWKEKMTSINKNLSIVNCSEGIDLIAGSDHHAEDQDHEHSGGFDPHVWLAPAEVKILAQNTLKALSKSFPEHATEFEKNFNPFIQKINTLSAQTEQKLSSLTNRNILIFHPALAYFAREFNLQQIPLELDGKEPSPKHMKDIVDLAHEQNIRVIFIQKEFDPAFAEQMAKEISGEVLVIDPLDYNWEKQMLDISEKIAAQK